MEKPPYLNDKTFNFLFQKILKYSTSDLTTTLDGLKYTFDSVDTSNRDNLTQLILDNPSPFLYHIGIFNNPEVLEDTVISLKDGLDFLIDRKVIEDIKEGMQNLKLKTLYKPKYFEITFEELEEAFKNGCEFDQLGQS